ADYDADADARTGSDDYDYDTTEYDATEYDDPDAGPGGYPAGDDDEDEDGFFGPAATAAAAARTAAPLPRRGPGPPRTPGPSGGPNPSRMPRAVVLKHRRRRRRAIIGLTAFLSATVTLVGSSYVYFQYRLGQIPRIDVPTLIEDRRGEIMNVLLVGSDSRDRLEGKDALQAGKGSVSGQRSDTIMVLHIDPRQEQAAILSIPRDLYLPIAGEGYSDRVNAAFSLGGAPGLIETIQNSLGITINHYVEMDFVGFKDIVDAVGGVKLYLPAWVRDFTSGLDLHEIGCVDVDGTPGLAWVRSRNFQYLLDDGLTWIDDPRGDLGRIERQQDFIRRMLKKALSSGLTNPLQLNRLIGIGVRDVTLDETLSTKDITTLARRFNNLDADSVALYTLPTSPDEIEGAQVLLLREAEAQPFLDRINGVEGAVIPGPGAPGAPATAPTTTVPSDTLLYPADVDIRVLNGEGTPGAAARAAADLESAGFEVSGTGDSPEIRRTTIRHPAEALGAAQLLDRALLGGADLVVDEDVTDSDVVLVIGADYEGLQVGPLTPIVRPPTPVTTTPAGTGSTTTVADATTTLPPTSLALPTLPPGEVC
ncbi:MAG: hypothetical protein QOE93_1838, partial [Actinomycetota bacterium]|nr:hypothetical protein [Actinomycetota bacterium]